MNPAGIRKTSGILFKKNTVGVYFGNLSETVSDSYFGGNGPDRTGCKFCGGCMVGCRHGAKNSLDFNYLYFAEKQEVRIFPDTEVLDVKPLQVNPEGKRGCQIFCRENTPNGTQFERSFKARGVVVFSAGALDTLPLLLKLRQNGSLPYLSARLGDQTRTNSESLI
jgi:Choline dehydrogenase and related flavoproteins